MGIIRYHDVAKVQLQICCTMDIHLKCFQTLWKIINNDCSQTCFLTFQNIIVCVYCNSSWLLRAKFFKVWLGIMLALAFCQPFISCASPPVAYLLKTFHFQPACTWIKIGIYLQVYGPNSNQASQSIVADKNYQFFYHPICE